jgi:hypothetical protein
MCAQGWNDCPAPALWTQRPANGIMYRQEAFAHVPGGQALRRGDEPLLAWVRFSVADLITALPLEEETELVVKIQAPHLQFSMSLRSNIRLLPHLAMYPRALTMERTRTGVRIVEPDGLVRLGVAPQPHDDIQFLGPYRDNPAYHLRLGLKVRKGAHVDLLLPIVPMERRIFDRELALGYDAALREANRFWAPQPATRASIRVPENFVTEAVRQSERLSCLVSEKNPATGKYCKISGSLHYANLWSTPMSMDLIMLMDTLGHHEFVGRYLEIFRDEQGTVVPPGDAYQPHPGYFSTPAAYKSIDWLSDNGAILYTLSMHGLLSGDAGYIRRFTEAIVKSCDWIKTHRALKGHGGYEGILPSARASDASWKIQSTWSDGWNYKGLVTAVRLLRKIGHPRAAEFARESLEYRAAFQQAFRHKCRTMPTWRDTNGRRQILVPTALTGLPKDERAATRHAFYLDTGSHLVFSGLMDAADPLMRGMMAWFREGPQWKFYRHDSNCWQVPVLDHEMSSCEPTYSWNVFHSWQAGDRLKFLEGMYSLFAGSISRQTFISCETRGGITGNVFSAPLAIYMARLAVVDDQFEAGKLHLLRLMPLAWLKPGAEARFERLPTEFGPVTLRTKVSVDGRTLEVVFKPAFPPGEATAHIVIHRPPIPGLKRLTVNGKAIPVTAKTVHLK